MDTDTRTPLLCKEPIFHCLLTSVQRKNKESQHRDAVKNITEQKLNFFLRYILENNEKITSNSSEKLLKFYSRINSLHAKESSKGGVRN